jgi:CRISPR/Cas system-associated exonuclease Cas4 (RecB family)
MGKVILEFDSVEEQEDIQSALNGYKWKLAMGDIDQLLRSTTKYDVSILEQNKPASEEEYNIAEKLREEIRDILNEYNLILD